jgi:hypothetical protein
MHFRFPFRPFRRSHAIGPGRLLCVLSPPLQRLRMSLGLSLRSGLFEKARLARRDLPCPIPDRDPPMTSPRPIHGDQVTPHSVTPISRTNSCRVPMSLCRDMGCHTLGEAAPAQQVLVIRLERNGTEGPAMKHQRIPFQEAAQEPTPNPGIQIPSIRYTGNRAVSDAKPQPKLWLFHARKSFGKRYLSLNPLE